MPKDEEAKIEEQLRKIEDVLAGPISEISIIKLVYSIVNSAYESRASDIHVDPAEDSVVIRLRIDGVLHVAYSLPKEIHPEVITRLKVISELRTDEHQIAQDGRFKFQATDKATFDVRVSIVPTYHGENAVLRLLVEQKSSGFTIESVGFSERDIRIVKESIAKPYGMVLVTGPTGSGKTTLLYNMLKILNTEEVSIITIEDPIEYSLPKTNQIQINNQTGLTFASGLRSILRQDPNIIMVGEIRDEETAKIGVNAALTGHLLLSTLHTNDAPTALPRLIDMGVEPFLIVSTVNMVIAQRLLRKICPNCKTTKKYPEDALSNFKSSSVVLVPKDNNYEFSIGKGCTNCAGSGYLGRIAIHEVLEMTPGIREAVIGRKGAQIIKEMALKEGMTTMFDDGLKKVVDGQTTVEELLRVMHE